MLAYKRISDSPSHSASHLNLPLRDQASTPPSGQFLFLALSCSDMGWLPCELLVLSAQLASGDALLASFLFPKYHIFPSVDYPLILAEHQS